MNISAINKARVCYWDKEGQCFVVTSPVFHGVSGHGSSKQQAYRVFERHLQSTYTTYLEGRLARNTKRDRGRPAKGTVSLDTDVEPETKEALVNISKAIDCSLGEVIDYLTLIYMMSGEAVPLEIPQGKESAPWHPLKVTLKAMGFKRGKQANKTAAKKYDADDSKFLAVNESVSRYRTGKSRLKTKGKAGL